MERGEVGQLRSWERGVPPGNWGIRVGFLGCRQGIREGRQAPARWLFVGVSPPQ